VTDELLKKIKFKSKNQLVAASKILEACTSYILLKEIIKPSRTKLSASIEEYITSHLDENITVPMLCKEFNISRTRLYALCNQYIPGGIASYVKTKRLLKAKDLLLTTDMTASDISLKVGFSDYNYFLKAFKKHFGTSTKTMRKSS
jgi:YesN/AraC family two-component response regulator